MPASACWAAQRARVPTRPSSSWMQSLCPSSPARASPPPRRRELRWAVRWHRPDRGASSPAEQPAHCADAGELVCAARHSQPIGSQPSSGDKRFHVILKCQPHPPNPCTGYHPSHPNLRCRCPAPLHACTPRHCGAPLILFSALLARDLSPPPPTRRCAAKYQPLIHREGLIRM